MIKLAKTLSMMLAGAAACAVIAAETSEPTPIKVWPRQERVNLPTNLEQFIFVEVPKLPVDGEFTIEMTLPENILEYGKAIRGVRHTYHRMASSVNR